MWAFLGTALKLVADRKWGVLTGAIAIALVVGAGTYARATMAKNAEEIAKLKTNQTQVAATLQVMQGTLQLVNENMKDIKDTVLRVDQTNRDTQKTVVDIYRDVYQIKLKQQGG